MFRHIIEEPENVDDINHNFRVLFDILGGQIDGPHISEKAISEVHLADDLLIPGHNVYVNQDTEFSTEYDPTEKVAIDDVGNLAYSDLVEKAMLGETIIDGGFIKTNMIHIDGSSLFGDGYDPTDKVAIDDAGNLAYENLVEKAMLGDTIIVGGYIRTNMIHIDGSSLFGDGYDPTEKVTYNEAGELAYSDLVEKAMLGDTIIVGGYIRTDMISVGSDSSFDVGYDPSVKLDSSDAGDLAYEDLVEEAMLGSTIISGGWIKTELLTADNIRTGTLSSVIIDVDTDVNIGRRLVMQNTSSEGAISFLDDEGWAIASIERQASDSVMLSAIGETTIGSGGPVRISSNNFYATGGLELGGTLDLQTNDITNVGTITASHVSTDTISIDAGWSGSFTNGDGATVQVSNGIITSVS